MSAATMDRRLAADRAHLQVRKGRALTRAGSMLKSSIPFKIWQEWADTVPGYCQIDLVGHEGGDANGQFCYTLTVTDVATGWIETTRSWARANAESAPPWPTSSYGRRSTWPGCIPTTAASSSTTT